MANASLVVQLRAQVGDFMSEFEKASTQAQKFEKQFQSTAKAVAGAFGVGLSVAGLTHFVTTIAAAASNIVDLSNKLGISTDAVQRFQYIANQTGTTIEVMSKAMFILGNAIAGDDQSAAAGLDKLGLSLSNLAAMNPEDRFNAVAIAAGKIGDATERNAILTQIFGSRTAQELAKAVDEWDELGRKAVIAGNDSVKAMADAEDATIALKDAAIAAALQGIGLLIIKYGELRQLVHQGSSTFREFERSIGGWGQAAADLVFGMDSSLWGSGGLPSAPGAPPGMAMPERIPPGLKVGTADYKAREDELNESIKKTNKSMDEAAAKAKAYADSIKDLRALISGVALQEDVKKLDEAWRGLSTSQQDSLLIMQRAYDASEKLRLSGADLTPALKANTDAWNAWTGSLSKILTIPVLDRLESLVANPIIPRLGVSGGIPGGAQVGTEIPIELPPEYRLGERIKDDLKRNLSDAPYIIGRALLEGGDVLKTISVDLGSLIGGSIGESIGTALGGVLGGKIGGALGSLLGPLIGKLFGDTEYEKRMKAAAQATQELIVSATEGAGSLDRLRHQFSIVGIQIDEAFKTRDPKWLKEVLDEGYAKTKLLDEAMKEYGFTWDNLGAEGRALQLGDLLTDLKAKTDVLIGAGVDELSVLQKQEAQYEDLLVKAIATNTEIPLAMKPLLERMQELGLLTDEATGQFIDLGQVTWAKSLTQGFDQVTKAIYDLRDALTKGVGGALDDLGKKSVRIPIGFDIENPKGVPALAGGGVVRRPTLALIGESGPEAVIPLSQMGGAGGGTQRITVNLDGDPLIKAVVKGMPSELELNGI